jgi:hypothetical protein
VLPRSLSREELSAGDFAPAPDAVHLTGYNSGLATSRPQPAACLGEFTPDGPGGRTLAHPAATNATQRVRPQTVPPAVIAISFPSPPDARDRHDFPGAPPLAPRCIRLPFAIPLPTPLSPPHARASVALFQLNCGLGACNVHMNYAAGTPKLPTFKGEFRSAR